MANLKLITEGIDLYTIDAVTSEVSGFEKENLQDRRLDTSWKATTTALQNIDIDTEDDNFSAGTFFLFHNISDNTEATTIKIYSDDNAGFSSPVQRGSTHTLSAGETHTYISLGAGFQERYWRIEIDGSDVAPEVYLIFFGLSVEAGTGISIRYSFGQREETVYDGARVVTSLGGYRSSRQFHSGRKRWEYQWENLDSTNELAMQAAIGFTKGAALPFFLQDIDENYHYVRFANPALGSIQAFADGWDTNRIIFEEEF